MSALLDTVPALQRLALSYAPRSAREPSVALFALDTRLAGLVRSSREPMLAQLRLAWWREQLGVATDRWPPGEPLLAALRSWGDEAHELAGLVDGWEALTGAAPLPPDAIARFAASRGAAFAALARVVAPPDAPDAAAAEAMRAGQGWALADLAARLSDMREREAAQGLLSARDWRRVRLPRALRPLAVLHGLAAASVREGWPLVAPPRRAMITSVRIGLTGR